MDTSTQRTNLASGYGSARYRLAGYWLATIPVVGEMGLGGIWDITRIPYVRDLVIHLGYPSYFLVLLGTWKVLGAVALLVPGLPLLKEWAYAGAFFTYTGATVSHLTTGYDLGEVGLLAVLTVLTVLSWALRPASRRPQGGWRRGPGGGSPAGHSPRRSLSHFFTGGGSPGAR
jgi:DoxX-like family